MELTILDSSLDAREIVDEYISLIWTERYDEYGDFEVELLDDAKIPLYRGEDTYILMKGTDRAMFVERREVTADPEYGRKVIIRGRSLESLLLRRIVWSQTVLTGDFQTAIETLLNENLIEPTDIMRRVNDFIFITSTDPVITGLTVDAQVLGGYLYDAIAALCKSVGLGFKIVFNENYQFEFSLYAGKNRAYSQVENNYVVFSPSFDNLANSEYIDSKEFVKNVALVAGEGEGSSKQTETIYKEGVEFEWEGVGRKEVYIDASDISKTTSGGTLTTEQYAAQLQQRGIEELANNSFLTSFTGEADPTVMYIYGTDYDLGDIIQIDDGLGHESESRVSEIIRSEDLSGRKIYPTFSKLE